MKAIRYAHKGQFLQNTLFWSQADFIGAFHGNPADVIFDPVLAAEEEALTIESHKQDFGEAFGIPVGEIECVVVQWDGDDASLPFADDAKGAVVRLPVPEPAPAPLTAFEQLKDALAAAPNIAPATKQAIAAIQE